MDACSVQQTFQNMMCRVFDTVGGDHGLECMFDRTLGVYAHGAFPFARVVVGGRVRAGFAQKDQGAEIAAGVPGSLNRLLPPLLGQARFGWFRRRSAFAVFVARRCDSVARSLGRDVVDAVLCEVEVTRGQRHDVDSDGLVVFVPHGAVRRPVAGFEYRTADFPVADNQQVDVGVRPVVAARTRAEQDHAFDATHGGDGAGDHTGAGIVGLRRGRMRGSDHGRGCVYPEKMRIIVPETVFGLRTVCQRSGLKSDMSIVHAGKGARTCRRCSMSAISRSRAIGT